MMNAYEAIGILEDEETSDEDFDDNSYIKERIFNLDSKNIEAELKLNEYRDIITMRRRWSEWLLFFIGLIVISDIFMAHAFGYGYMNFSEDKGNLPIFAGESLIKVLGLALIVVNFLFNDKKRK